MEWQPIKTAPKDGTVFAALSFVGKEPYVTAGNFEKWESETLIGFHDHNASEWFEDPDFWPTHWMPLPEPPKTSAT